jgi:DNA-binding SARP family transcriptional activator/tetratricopeptide (TPR) repeat protein
VAGSTQVEVRLLGRFAVLKDGAEIPPTAFGGRKVRTLLKILASRQGRFVSNDVLAAALWPDRLPGDPVANLQVLVTRARRALGDSRLIVTGQGGYTLADGPGCVVDAQLFLAAEGRPDEVAQLIEALTWWRGDPLPEEAYDDWAAEFRGQLTQARQHTLERVAAGALADRDADSAVEMASRALEAEPLREAAVVLLMRAQSLAGDGAAALTTYDEYRRLLAAELGVDPSPEASELYQSLLRRLPSRESAAKPRTPRGAGHEPGQSLGDLAFVGREQELAHLRRALTSTRRQGSVVMVSGVSGSGKSRLLDVLARDVPLIRARAYLAESAEPWSLLRSLLREVLARDIGFLVGMPRPMHAALAWLLPELEGGGATTDPESRRALLVQVALRLVDAVDAAVAVDDVQWCDPSSLEVLEALVGRGPDPGVVLAFRPDEAAERVDVASFLARRDVALRVSLGGLTESSLRDLVADEMVGAAIASHTDRTPMAVSEVLRALVADGLAKPAPDGRVVSVSSDAPGRAIELAIEGQRTAIRARVAEQLEADRHLLALLALLGRESSARLLAEAVRSAEPDVLDVLTRLQRHNLVRLGDHGWAPSHDMVTEVVADDLDPAEKVRHHASLARALASHDDPALLAHHLREAGDMERAARAYALAAQHALDAFADDEATVLAEMGLALEPPGAVRAVLHETRGEARHRSGDIAGARQDMQEALALWPPGPDHARLLSRLAMLALGADDIVRGSQLAELAVAEAGDDGPTRARALEVASILDMNLAAPQRAADRAAMALGLYERLGDTGGMARIADARAMAQFLDGRIAEGGAALRRAAELFEDAGDLVRVVTPRSTGGHALSFGGRGAEGLPLVTAARELARNLGHAEGQSFASWHRAEVLAALGRHAEAAEDAAEALAIATRIGHRGWTATGWRAVGIAAQEQGDLEAAREAFTHSLGLSDNLGLFASWASSRLALVLVASGSVAQAPPYVRRALAEGPPLGHYEARWAEAEVASALGDPRTPELARAALERMDAGGVQLGRERLVALSAVSESR